jgi:hypothetical protein
MHLVITILASLKKVLLAGWRERPPPGTEEKFY